MERGVVIKEQHTSQQRIPFEGGTQDHWAVCAAIQSQRNRRQGHVESDQTSTGGVDITCPTCDCLASGEGCGDLVCVFGRSDADEEVLEMGMVCISRINLAVRDLELRPG